MVFFSIVSACLWDYVEVRWFRLRRVRVWVMWFGWVVKSWDPVNHWNGLDDLTIQVAFKSTCGKTQPRSSLEWVAYQEPAFDDLAGHRDRRNSFWMGTSRKRVSKHRLSMVWKHWWELAANSLNLCIISHTVNGVAWRRRTSFILNCPSTRCYASSEYFNHLRHSCHDTKESTSQRACIVEKLRIMKALPRIILYLIVSPSLSPNHSFHAPANENSKTMHTSLIF